MARSLAVRPARAKLSFWGIWRTVFRLVPPVTMLLGVYIAAYVSLDKYVTVLDVFPDEKWFLNPGYWLTVGHFVLPLAWLATSLTNRRHGEGYALAQLLITWTIIGLVALATSHLIEGGLPASPLPSRRVSLAFIFAILVGQIIGIYVFDRTRGRTWWGAPLFSALWGQTFFVLTFYTLAYVGMSDPWTNFMLMDLAIKLAAAFLMLIPYYLLRPLIRPMPGFGGA
jgi:uncharacterized PurR-regulated membrane protein YhhQ (DUF165 family)